MYLEVSFVVWKGVSAVIETVLCLQHHDNEMAHHSGIDGTYHLAGRHELTVTIAVLLDRMGRDATRRLSPVCEADNVVLLVVVVGRRRKISDQNVIQTADRADPSWTGP